MSQQSDEQVMDETLWYDRREWVPIERHRAAVAHLAALETALRVVEAAQLRGDVPAHVQRDIRTALKTETQSAPASGDSHQPAGEE